jgi:Suppressor of fused protein (SUFU)
MFVELNRYIVQRRGLLMAESTNEEDEWGEWWDARVAAMESVLDPSHDMVGHAPVPFHLGADIGGAADIVYFKRHLKGVVAATSELIGCDDQVENDLGNYELMICHRDDEEWGPEIISRLAYYTLEAKINPGDTMEMAGAAPEGSTIAAFLFFNYAIFQVRGRKAGLLLCMGITEDELKACRAGEREKVETTLKAAKIYPFTDLFRDSVLTK